MEAQEDRVRRRRLEAIEGEVDAGHDQGRVARVEQERLQRAGDSLFILHDEDPHFREARTPSVAALAVGSAGRDPPRASKEQGKGHQP